MEEKKDQVKSFMFKLPGQKHSFHCECDCNCFHIIQDYPDKTLYQCNACDARY